MKFCVMVSSVASTEERIVKLRNFRLIAERLSQWRLGPAWLGLTFRLNSANSGDIDKEGPPPIYGPRASSFLNIKSNQSRALIFTGFLAVIPTANQRPRSSYRRLNWVCPRNWSAALLLQLAGQRRPFASNLWALTLCVIFCSKEFDLKWISDKKWQKWRKNINAAFATRHLTN